MEINFDLKGYFTLLNLGCGQYTSPNAGLRGIMESFPCKIAMDIVPEYLETWEKNAPSWIPILGDIKNLSMFVSKSVDMICALDVIEHLNREEGLELLLEIDRIAKKKAIIWTPDGFINTITYQMQEWKDMNYKFSQLHRSGWYKEDFETFGYEVHVLEDYHHLKDEYFNAILAIKEY